MGARGTGLASRVLARAVAAGVALLVPWACADHNPVLDRVGGPLPSYDAGKADVDADVNDECPLPVPDGTQELPCDVQGVLVDKCQRCHQDPPLNGAPFPLLTWANTQADYFDKPIYVRMQNAVSQDIMPFCAKTCADAFSPPVQSLTADQKKTLLDWLVCPMPVTDAGCSD